MILPHCITLARMRGLTFLITKPEGAQLNMDDKQCTHMVSKPMLVDDNFVLNGPTTTSTPNVISQTNPSGQASEVTAKKDRISQRLLTDDAFVLKALAVLLDNQTHEERRLRKTKDRNGVGFDGPDAKRLTALAEDAVERGCCTPEELDTLRRRDKRGYPPLAKYWKQLWPLMEEEPVLVPLPRKPPGTDGSLGYVEGRVS
jgi:hypothetical protein